MAESGFAERLAYWRWLRNEGKLAPETDGKFAAAVGVGPKWLGKWKGSHKAPDGLTEALALSAALADVGGTLDWLYKGTGVPPRPKDWARWYAQRVRERRQEIGTTTARGAAKKRRGNHNGG